MDENLRKQIEDMMKKYQNSSVDVINTHLQDIQNKYNNTGQDRFDGLSPELMRGILYGKWGENIITINPNKNNGDDMPIIKQIKYFLKIVEKEGEIKQTNTGNLPPSIVKDIYHQKYILDTAIELGITKLTKETDVDNIVMMKILCKIAGLIKARNNKISLTKNAAKLINSSGLFEKLFEITCQKYNWGYFDCYTNPLIGKLGYNYTLYLLDKYGREWEDEKYYAKLYFKAFDQFLGDEEYYLLESCYIHRTINQIMKYYGLIEHKNKELERGEIKKTEIFDKYIKIGMYVV
jgi:hypothetical protein